MERYRRSPFVKTIFSCRIGKKSLLFPKAHLITRFVEATVSKIKEETGARSDCLITTPIDEKTKRSLTAVFENVFANEYPRGNN